MDPVSPLTPSLRVDRINLYQDNKQQQTPFGRGRILQGRITGKSNNQFILDVEGQQWIADSKASLRVGQRLKLQVTGTTPNITLQILTDPLTQNIGKSLHLLAAEGRLLPRTIDIATQLPEGTLSSSSKETLAFFKDVAAAFTTTKSGSDPAGSQMARLLSNLFSSSDTGSQKNSLAALSNFLNKLAQTLPQQDPDRVLAGRLQQQIGDVKLNSPLQEFLLGKNNPDADKQLRALLQNIGRIPSSEGNSLTGVIMQFTSNDKALSPSPLLLQLLTLTGNFLLKETGIQKPEPTGKNIEAFTKRLGINLEQLLVSGRTKEAVQTLKSALLEISHNLSEHTSLHHQAAQLTSTIELLQMLQIRLSDESLFFLPLPLPFLNQGFLLVEPDQKQSGDQQGEKTTRKYSLHLELTGLGNLQIDLEQQAGGIRLRFYTQDSARTKFLAEHRQELQQWLTATKMESVQFLTGAEDPIKHLLSRMSDETTGMLNTRA
jgi:hypothetical protein